MLRELRRLEHLQYRRHIEGCRTPRAPLAGYYPDYLTDLLHFRPHGMGANRAMNLSFEF
jgi:hypothetical protein